MLQGTEKRPAADFAEFPSGSSSSVASPDEHLHSQTSAVAVRLRNSDEIGAASWASSGKTPPDQAKLFINLHRSDPEAAHLLAQSSTAMPEVGTELLGFRLLADLGEGAFARVYLAQQGDLANRHVVLKVSTNIDEELQTLAQLQHTNIVPIYSVHRAEPLQAVCMPYFGATTLANVLQEWRGRDSLPLSGKELVSTIVNRKSTVRGVDSAPILSPFAPRKGVLSRSERRHTSSGPAAAPTEMPSSAGSTANLQILEAFSYVEAVLWIGSRLADGLVHAHQRGIVHRDLKPANILLTDEGQPMLLDFNLAHDTKVRNCAAVAQVGGTLPFMAPEQIQAYRTETLLLDYRSDVYSLGLMLYELLTGRHPFPNRDGAITHVLDKMIEDRSAPPPEVCRYNKAVSPAVEAIVRRCLEPEPNRRYQTAAQLKEDLDRHADNLPLKHATEPSIRERAGKWRRRHPRLTSTTTVLALAGIVIAGLLSLAMVRGQRLAEIDARAALSRFLDDKKAAQYLLTAQLNDAGQVESGTELCRNALRDYDILNDPSWHQKAAVRHLAPAERSLLKNNASELLQLWAQAVALQASNQSDEAARAKFIADAVRLNSLAEACADTEQPSRALLGQRAKLHSLLGRDEDAKRLQAQALTTPLQSSADHYLVAAEHIANGQVNDALPLLVEATNRDPQDFWAWFLLGVCRDQMSSTSEAVACYGTCIALAPSSPWAYLNRGLAHLRQQNYKQAGADLDKAIELRPKLAEAYRNRALARQGLKKYDEAIADLTCALELGASPTQIYFLRAEARKRAGDTAGAQRDRQEGFRHEPQDEMGWLSRGYARMSGEPEAALADFDKALKFNPRSLAALQNKAHVLSKLGRNDEAAKALDKAVLVYPDFVRARAGRGVMLARLGQRDAAHQDADACLARNNEPVTLYQLAGIYALTSQQNAADRQQAFRLLSVSLQKGFGFDLLDTDRDLDPIRNCPEFRTLVAAAHAIRSTATAKNQTK